jgi:hypothetical protein
VTLEAAARVCPHCGELPGPGVFCAACGRNLSAVQQLPTREEWEATADAPVAEPVDPAAATQDFLARMAAAGNPGAKKLPFVKRKAFERAGKAHCWVVRPVDREDFGERAGHYVAGLVLTVEGDFHVLESQLTGHGQRGFPHYWHTVRQEPAPPPPGEELVAALDVLLAKHKVSEGA